VDGGVNGFVFPLGDYKKLTEQILSLVEGKEKLKQFSEKSLQKIKEYSYERDIEALLGAL